MRADLPCILAKAIVIGFVVTRGTLVLLRLAEYYRSIFIIIRRKLPQDLSPLEFLYIVKISFIVNI